MKLITLLLVLMMAAGHTNAQKSKKPEMVLKNVEAACGECKLGMKGQGCNLAIRVDGKSYFVDNTKIDDHGDAHADDGFCNKVRRADVTGKIVRGRFVASEFTLLEEKKAPTQ